MLSEGAEEEGVDSGQVRVGAEGRDAGDEAEEHALPEENAEILRENVPRDGVKEIVRELARICFTHNISDNAVEDMLGMFCRNAQEMTSLLQTGQFRGSWRNFARPKALESCPKVKSSYLVERLYGGEVQHIFRQDLDRIPKDILSLPYDGTRRLLRTTAYVSLEEIKAHHRKLHEQRGVGEEETRRDFQHAHVSVDGMQESQKGTRSLTIISVRLGDCIYLHSVWNPLIGVPASRPSPTDLLR